MLLRCVYEEPKDTKGVIRIRKWEKNRKHNGQKKVQKDKHISTKQTHKTKDRVTRAPLKTGVIRKGIQFLLQ